MKILQINSAKVFGGGERHFIDLCHGLNRHEHLVFAVLRSNNQWERNLNFLDEENIIHAPLRNSLDVFSGQRIAKLVQEKGIEIIHAHVARDYSIAALASRLSKTPLILTRHLTYKLSALHRLTFSQAEKVIAVSSGVKESLINTGFVMKDKIAVIYNGVDVDSLGNIERNNDLSERFDLNSNLVVATIGELREHKGQEEFIKAAAVIAKKNQKVKFLIIGKDNSASQEYRVYLERLVEKLNLKNQVVFTGWQEKISEYYGLCDVFVSSARSEPFGLVIAEAMASGKAIVATKTVGAKELLIDNESGKLVEVGNIEQLAETISELLDNKELSQTLGKNAQIRAKEFFSLERIVSETEKIYQAII